MTGFVVWWPYAIVDIPNGWALCDGQNGTPDYRNYCLIGAGDLYTPGQVLGSLSHDHLLNVSPSTVVIQDYTEESSDFLDDGYDVEGADYVPTYSYETYGHDHEIDVYGAGHDHAGDTDEKSNLPPCKAGCWVIKL